MRKDRCTIKTAKVVQNTGQFERLPRNPRQWTKEDIDKTAKSITEDADFLEDRPVLVIPRGDQYVAFAGNLRLTAAKHVKLTEVPCVVYEPESDEDWDTIKRRAMKDNGSFGAWDFDALANEWDDLPLTDWGVPAWETDADIVSKDEGKKEGERKKIDFVEKLIDDAMRENVKEAVQQIDYTMQRGWIASFFTRGLAQAKFIRAKYYGEHYPQWMSLYFCPERFKTSAKAKSVYEALVDIAEERTNAGIAGCRTVTGDHLLLLLLLKGSYPIASARMPMDFPANRAADLIREFAPGGKILDPCHGWGGRLTGAMLADAAEYVGVDPSEDARRGVEKIADAFAQYSPATRAEFILSPFEDADLGGREFDMAITSPPYFDVEQYHGEGQAHIRYPKYDLWRDGFYATLIEKVYRHIKVGGVFILQVGSQSYPLLKDGTEIARRVGFAVEEIRPLGGSTGGSLHGNSDEDEDNEKIIVLRK